MTDSILCCLPELALFSFRFAKSNGEIQFPDAADLLSKLIERLDSPATERPTAFRHPVAPLEVDFIQRHIADVCGGFTTNLVIPKIGGATKLPTGVPPATVCSS